MINYTVGADPEIFVTKNGVLSSAYGLVDGTKERPTKVEQGAVQVDGMALEFNIDPATNKKEFGQNIAAVMEQLKQMVPEYELLPAASVHFDKNYLDSQPEEAKELGCNPDYNAYTGKENPAPNADTTLRTAAGHVHIGWTEGQNEFDPDHMDHCIMVVKELDISLGLMSVIIDKDKERRELYGKAGAFRPKSYGVEYRVLSNFWLKDKNLIDWVYDQVNEVMSRLCEGNTLSEKYGEAVQKIIDTGDVSGAYELVFGLDIKFPEGYIHEV